MREVQWVVMIGWPGEIRVDKALAFGRSGDKEGGGEAGERRIGSRSNFHAHIIALCETLQPAEPSCVRSLWGILCNFLRVKPLTPPFSYAPEFAWTHCDCHFRDASTRPPVPEFVLCCVVEMSMTFLPLIYAVGGDSSSRQKSRAVVVDNECRCAERSIQASVFVVSQDRGEGDTSSRSRTLHCYCHLPVTSVVFKP